MIDGKKRALTKAFSWRFLASCILGVITWLTTGSLKSVGIITLVYNLVQIVTYFLHERFWNGLSWGKTTGLFIQMTGMSGAGKSTIAHATAEKLRNKGYKVEIIDGDHYRHNVTSDLGFSKKDRLENIKRLGFVGRVLARNNVIAILAAINPYASARCELAKLGAFTVFVKCDLSTLKDRDPKGLYKLALLPEDHPDRIKNFTGISDPYEIPENPDLVIDTAQLSLDESVNKMVFFVEKNV